MEFYYFLFFIVAFLYSSVGHGGASSYLALLALLGISNDLSKSSALVLNILVASIAFVNFYRVIDFPKKTFLWLVLGSIPASFLGSKIPIDPNLYKFILGCLLLISSIRLLDLGKLVFSQKTTKPESTIISTVPTATLLIGIGIPIGLVSGMIGIGGGIILSPVILLLGWHNAKETAAISAAFIVANSIAGLVGKPTILLELSHPSTSDFHHIVWILVASIIGGLFGSWKGASDFSNSTIKRILAIVLNIAAIKLIIAYLVEF
ncbi:MAG: hypothetical protein RLZZ252_939 [Bacteroidota bacterium]|jgi:uncharacterized membrane protein YfcA